MNLGLPDLTPWQKDTTRIADALEGIQASLVTIAEYAEAAHVDLLTQQRRGDR